MFSILFLTACLPALTLLGRNDSGDSGDTGDPPIDVDGDGFTVENDCNDADADVNPDADEICDEVDNNCDRDIDEDNAVDAPTWYLDVDNDGYGDPDVSIVKCSAPSSDWLLTDSDCDDSDVAINPDADELCDEVDNNCDGDIDEDSAVDALVWYADSDSDSYGDPDVSDVDCYQPSGYVADATDCDDDNAEVRPDATEVCDTIDNDCDSEVDEDDAADVQVWYADTDSDSYGNAAVTDIDCYQPSGYVPDATDCDDTNVDVNPIATEVCNTLDDDCDGEVDEDVKITFYADSDSDGYGDSAVSVDSCSAPTSYVVDVTDCDDSSATVYPSADEFCNGIDDNCDGDVDEDSAVDAIMWYADSDLDGYGDPSTSLRVCDPPSGYVADATDCDDGSIEVNPIAIEVCDEIDNNCDAQVDEDLDCTDDDLDGYTVSDGDCDDADADVNPGETEVCNDGGVDQNCDSDVTCDPILSCDFEADACDFQNATTGADTDEKNIFQRGSFSPPHDGRFLFFTNVKESSKWGDDGACTEVVDLTIGGVYEVDAMVTLYGVVGPLDFGLGYVAASDYSSTYLDMEASVGMLSVTIDDYTTAGNSWTAVTVIFTATEVDGFICFGTDEVPAGYYLRADDLEVAEEP